MTNKPRSSGFQAGAPMNRMMSNDYEKRGMTTAHLRQAVADRSGKGPPASGSQTVPLQDQPKRPTSNG